MTETNNNLIDFVKLQEKKAMARQYAKNHREKYKNDVEKIEKKREYFRRYKEENKERLNQTRKKYYEANREELINVIKNYQKNNPKWKEYLRKEFQCCCGATISNASKSYHLTSKTHRLFVEDNKI